MRLYKYLSISSDDETSAFRSLNIDLVDEDTGNVDLVRVVASRYGLDVVTLSLLERANKELKKMYRGKFKFDFCLEDQGFNPENINIDKRKARQIKEKWFKFNNELSEIQMNLEKSLQK